MFVTFGQHLVPFVVFAHHMIQSSSLFEKFLQGKFSLLRDLENAVEELQKEVKTINQVKENSFYERSKSVATNQMLKKTVSGTTL